MRNTFKKNLLNSYEERGLLYSQVHPNLPLRIWNYSQLTAYDLTGNSWDDVTLACRGLVTDLDGERLVSRGFPKFFNIEERKHIPTESFQIYKKMDGQYIGVFLYNGEVVVNSRGSFTSEYAKKAREIFLTTYANAVQHLQPNRTYVFELVGFERIVVKYDEMDLIFLGSFENILEESFEEYFCEHVKHVEKYDGLDYKAVKGLDLDGEEGYVVLFSNGNRCKIKFDNYIQLHRVVTNLSNRYIFNELKENGSLNRILNYIPDEFYPEVKRVEDELKAAYSLVENECFYIVVQAIKNCETRKEIAEYFKGFSKTYRNICFKMLECRGYSASIWGSIEPKFKKL